MVADAIREGRRARAAADVKLIASAVTSFYKDVGVWPARRSTGVDHALNILGSGPTLPGANPFASDHQFAAWLQNPSHGDTLDNHLRSNTPGGAATHAYPATGAARWRGPYAAAAMPLDPWGRPYLVTVIAGWSTHPSNYKRLIVLSAGPDGEIDTQATLAATTTLADDDIGMILSQRQ
jgi:hypothetical protein